uniref:Uncharacterized protein n=1 Tax=Grammatophora oceanica TaxID=210454 RepID=A0A7S1YEE8_9STRA|mmetsp:Transcript_44907/g.66672  ORF Transcript_44907/g.66672 Transcript_44907/m.66672 type:complete len:162 (+) Transcript_44907:62-547(+)|eukprot:CAMPEP_0194035582 /NCGR_PEP_ID=MMETSP0009_2-20130614/7986_1 /TAXON_ID=210454 /ORGANISM="Grammatophora oceanica, Strain CCMP 410" /LENGTH=161 /DNA_ID=CAMNT_0038676985 /DNA_START=60 /DNA_END=545 /DNA_ORIENTATION=-
MTNTLLLLALLIAVVALSTTEAFSGSSFSGSRLSGVGTSQKGSMTMEYIPNGMSKEQWNKLKSKEKTKAAGKNLGKVGITTFKSRSFSDWQKAGGKNLFPVDPTKVKNPKDLPYMQRPGGSADDSDISGKKGGMFSMFGNKKKKEEKKPEPPKKSTNWWTL